MGPPSGKKHKMLDRVAEECGVAIVVQDELGREVSISNNNSICRALTASTDFAPKCDKFCGVAFQKTRDGSEFDYTCYAGLTCKAISVKDREKQFVAIIGRTFTSAAEYRNATDRAIEGDWRHFRPNEFFENVLMDSSVSKIDKAREELGKFRVRKEAELPDLKRPVPTKQTPASVKEKRSKLATPVVSKPTPESKTRSIEASQTRSLIGQIKDLDYERSIEATLAFVRRHFDTDSTVWLESKHDDLVSVVATGAFQEKPLKIGIKASNARLIEAAALDAPLELRERATGREATEARSLHLFPFVHGKRIRGALGVEGRMEARVLKSIPRLLRHIVPSIEEKRSDRKTTSRERISRATERFTDSFKRIDSADFWTQVTQISAELVQSERASLLVRKEPAERLTARAAIGARIDLHAEPEVGSRISRVVLETGKPVVVTDIGQTRVKAAPHEWQYKTPSFISYPILIGDRRLAVMNFTNKVDGAAFDESDVELLNAVMPQIAVAIDRTTLKEKAGEFEQLSVTDALTGLLNRRYLERRLDEEIERSKRHHFPMSLMMLDVDDFKSYNDTFGHPAGDAALKIVAGVLQDVLRGADVAARYGGEEFAILLPQTTSLEAAAIAERLRQRIEHTEFPKRKVTISIGIASCSKDVDTPENLIGAADHALYEAKNHGRNNVQIYDGFDKSLNEKIH